MSHSRSPSEQSPDRDRGDEWHSQLRRDRERRDERYDRHDRHDRHGDRRYDDRDRNEDRERYGDRERHDERERYGERDRYSERDRYEDRDRYGERDRHEDRERYGDRDRDRDDERQERRERGERRRSPRRARPSPPPTSAPAGSRGSASPPASPTDWYCRCGSYNFKRRDVCYRRECRAEREVASVPAEGATRRVLLRRLDALTTEEDVRNELRARCSRRLVAAVRSVTVGREPRTGVSKCLAYIEFDTVEESAAALAELHRLRPPLELSGRRPLLSHYKEVPRAPPGTAATHAAPPAPPPPPHISGPSGADLTETDRVNAAAAVAHSAMTRLTNQSAAPALSPAAAAPPLPPTGDGTTRYPPPAVAALPRDPRTGYRYDPATGLYYDDTSHYFYNSTTGHYMYWDAANCVYVRPREDGAAPPPARDPDPAPPAPARPPEEKKKKDKEDKVKVAKKIAKDMERWARAQNMKKEAPREVPAGESTGPAAREDRRGGAADIGFSVLGARPDTPPSVARLSPPPLAEPELPREDATLLDRERLACLLCRRQFKSLAVLERHAAESSLHRENLAARRAGGALPGYRDRAAERRLQCGTDAGEPPGRARRPPPVDIVPAPPQPVVDTVGGRMLQKMGWKEGSGLGRAEDGRLAPVTAEMRPALAGLGQKRGIYTPPPGETYRDTVKKLMIARYKEVLGQEQHDQ